MWSCQVGQGSSWSGHALEAGRKGRESERCEREPCGQVGATGPRGGRPELLCPPEASVSRDTDLQAHGHPVGRTHLAECAADGCLWAPRCVVFPGLGWSPPPRPLPVAPSPQQHSCGGCRAGFSPPPAPVWAEWLRILSEKGLSLGVPASSQSPQVGLWQGARSGRRQARSCARDLARPHLGPLAKSTGLRGRGHGPGGMGRWPNSPPKWGSSPAPSDTCPVLSSGGIPAPTMLCLSPAPTPC